MEFDPQGAPVVLDPTDNRFDLMAAAASIMDPRFYQTLGFQVIMHYYFFDRNNTCNILTN